MITSARNAENGTVQISQARDDQATQIFAMTDTLAERVGKLGGMREAHTLCDEFGDVATASLLENRIDETEGRIWFVSAAGNRG